MMEEKIQDKGESELYCSTVSFCLIIILPKYLTVNNAIWRVFLAHFSVFRGSFLFYFQPRSTRNDAK